MAKQNEVLSTRTGELIEQRMQQMGIDKRELSAKLGVTYETVRTILNGQKTISVLMLPAVCSILKLNVKEMEKLLKADRMEMKFGDLPAELSGRNPELAPIERVWDKMSPEHQQDLITYAKAFAARDKK